MVEPGDLLLVHTTRPAARWINFASALAGTPSMVDHVAIAHHRDDTGTLWVIEGRPGGVGWRDARAYLTSSYTLTNARQPKTPQQRETIAGIAQGLLGTPYDWEGIITDAMASIGAHELWRQNWRDQGPPGHVVCSSLAAYAYEACGLDIPPRHAARATTPADWAQFVLTHNYVDRP
jgi:hypothetical protein